MPWFYGASALFGGVFVLLMILGGLDFEGDVDLDFDSDVDFDVDVDIDSPDVDFDTSGVLGDIGQFFASLISFRSLVFFAAFFGLIGLAFEFLTDSNVLTTFLAALVGGGFAAVVNGQLFKYLKGSEASSELSNRQIAGRAAQVVIPLGPSRRGRIKADIDGQPHFLVALPFKEKEDMHFDVGDSVVVVEVHNGTALVAPLPGLEDGRE